ncbi:MAG: type IV pilus twitching motility protein PilT [Oscillospiraceae bacterium]|nr:type IV pilus twitching motility protein PilT [Oscillospiraceae bacterium]
MNLLEILKSASEKKASDIFIVAGLALSMKIKGEIISVTDSVLKPDDTASIIKEIFGLAKNENWDKFLGTGDADFSFSIYGVGRFRVNTYRQRGSLAAVLRIISFGLPDPDMLGIPKSVIDLYKKTKGLILVTGPTGSGKSTTLACIVDAINTNRKVHIMTLEDPIEFLHPHKQSIVSQREILSDTESYLRALKAALRQSPDVIFIGEMRDYETVSIALTAAETGHLVLSTLHTMGAANTIDRIIDFFPSSQQQQIRVQLAMTLQAVISQQIVPTADKGLAAAFEVMMNTTAVANMIREGKLHQINSTIHTSGDAGMQTMDSSLIALVKKGVITKETAMVYSANPEIIARMLA